MLLRPTRVRAKPARFHISPSGYAKNAPDFTFPNKDSPKTRSILGPNLRRGFFRGVCFCALHGHVQNLAGFIFPHTDTPKTHPISPSQIRIHPKPAQFYTQTFVAGHFGAYAFAPLHGYMKNLVGFIFPHLNTPKTHLISPFPIGIHQKRTRFHPLQ